MEIGTIIRNARNEASLTQEQAAESLGVSRQTISNWENNKSYPDIISVIKMSDLYSVSLDCLLKEETSMKQTYKEYLSESTNAVKSHSRLSKLSLVLTTIGLWALSVLAFWLVESGTDASGYSLAVMWGVLPVTFFSASFIMGVYDYFGKAKWIAPLLFGIMHSLRGHASMITLDDTAYKQIIWPDFTKIPIGLIISLAGLVIGVLIHNKNKADS